MRRRTSSVDYIGDECVDLCTGIIAQELGVAVIGARTATDPPRTERDLLDDIVK